MNKVIILLGPTCVGKTKAAMLLAKALNTEIISADSMQVYRHMDIGTAKPSHEELTDVKHHLIDILNPSESFSAGIFRDMAVKLINELHCKGKAPIIAGGTGLYIRTLTQGLFEAAKADWQLRGKLIEEERLFGKGHLHEKLKGIDPKSAEKINPNDLRRIVRALEVATKEDKTISELQQMRTAPEPYEFIKIGLSRDRKELYSLIEQRVDSMMANGLVHETDELLKMNPYKTAMQSLGYKEISLYLNGGISHEEAVRLLKKRTKMYAKRQVTWFKKEPDIKWIDISGLMGASEIFNRIANDVEIIRELLYVKGAY